MAKALKAKSVHRNRTKTESATKPINIALQGGGAHGAFAWGVLDKILEDGRLAIDGICGTSAGAMNGVVYAYGKMTGDRDGARQALHDFWQDISKTGQALAPVHGPFDQFIGRQVQQAAFSAFETMSRVFSPYQFNPLNFNPLREVLERHVDFQELHDCYCTNIFVCATNARNGKPRIFTNKEITADTVLASACLPFLFQAVEIEGEYYWDGGYIGNPALYPMIYDTDTQDFLIVHINPIERPEVAKTAPEIMNRINELTFNSSLVREMRAIAFVQKMISEGWIKDEYRTKLKQVRIHAIRADEDMRSMDVASKFDSDWKFLTSLRDLGRARAEMWLKEKLDQVGKESSINIAQDYL